MDTTFTFRLLVFGTPTPTSASRKVIMFGFFPKNCLQWVGGGDTIKMNESLTRVGEEQEPTLTGEAGKGDKQLSE